MLHREFQDEPNAAPPVTAMLSEAAARSLFLGLTLRGYLSGSECEWLMALAPDRWQIFMIDGEEMVYPLEECPFSPQIVACGGNEFGDAVFSQRHHVSTPGSSRVIRIHTAIINPGEQKPLMIGFYGPETNRCDQSIEERFFEIVGHLRRAHRGLDCIARRVHESLAVTVPVVAVNRSSGRVVATNRAALAVLECDDSALVDHEFGQLVDPVGSCFSGRSLTMRNVSDSCLSLCLLSWPEAALPRSSAAERTGDHETESMPRPLSLITRAAQLLAEMDDPELDPRQRVLVEDILTNARQLERDLDQQLRPEAIKPEIEPSMDLVLK